MVLLVVHPSVSKREHPGFPSPRALRVFIEVLEHHNIHTPQKVVPYQGGGRSGTPTLSYLIGNTNYDLSLASQQFQAF